MGLKQSVSIRDGLRYQGKGPMLAYILHRVGGLGIVIFVALHVLASFLANQPWGAAVGVFINTIYEHWTFQIVIFFCALFHAVNGLRIVILDLFTKLQEYQREAIWLEWFVFIPLFAISVLVIVQTALAG